MIGGYSGDADDSLATSNGKPFVARQRDSNSVLMSGWWRDTSLSDGQLLNLSESQHFANFNALT